MKTIFLSASILIGACCTPLFAQSLGKAPVIFKKGDWSIRQSSDSMTDKKSCVALYKDRFDVQISANSFSISFRGKGGVKFITYRLDENQPINRLPTEIEKDLSVLFFEGSEFQKVISAKRIRVQILSVLDRIIDEDIDLKDVEELIPIITECKAPSMPQPTLESKQFPEKSQIHTEQPFDLKSELEKLNKMRKGKLITEKEYKELRARAIEKAKS